MNPQDLLKMITDLISSSDVQGVTASRNPANFEFAPGSAPNPGYGPAGSSGVTVVPGGSAPSRIPTGPQRETLEDWQSGRGTGRDIFTDTTLNLGRQFGYTSPDEILGYLPSFRQIASEQGNSAEFQRELYRQISGQEPPENYTGFHASQADRITNVFNPDEADINVMKEVAFIATAMREIANSGFGPWGGGSAQPQYRPPVRDRSGMR
jgi:hypothetical protein